MVVAEHSAQTVVALDGAITWRGIGGVLREEDRVVLALVRPLVMVMGDVLHDGVLK